MLDIRGIHHFRVKVLPPQWRIYPSGIMPPTIQGNWLLLKVLLYSLGYFIEETFHQL
jgi:hypothetical protein